MVLPMPSTASMILQVDCVNFGRDPACLFKHRCRLAIESYWWEVKSASPRCSRRVPVAPARLAFG